MLIGILGGGQLARMLALAGYPLGLRFRCLDTSLDAPVRDLCELHVGPYDDERTLAAFAEGLDLVTYEFENIDPKGVRWLAERVPVWPPLAALETGQDRLFEKTLFKELGLGVHPFEAVQGAAGLASACGRLGLPVVAKTRRMGYDGKGQRVIRSHSEIPAAASALGDVPLLVEQFVPFDRELSIVAVRGRTGEFRAYPLVENVHRGGILRKTTAPAPGVSPELQRTAEGHARTVMERLGYVGVLAIEVFEVQGGLLANEMAPRVHNTGHWTIEGAVTSQFENHCRAVAGLPLGDTSPRGHSVMLNLIGSIPELSRVLSMAGAHLHLYGKDPRPGRKVGHITITAESADQARERAASLAGALT